jgi:AraC family transcriptional regulator
MKKMFVEEIMEPVKFVTLPAFRVMGMEYVGNNANQEISGLWQQFNQHAGELKGEEKCCYGVCSVLPGSKAGWMEYVAGLKVSKTVECPQGMVIFDVPANTYAVFEHHGAMSGLHATYVEIAAWWKESGRQPAGNYDMEVYDEKFLDFKPHSVFYIYEPVK